MENSTKMKGEMSPWLIIALQEGQYSLKPEWKERNDTTWCVFYNHKTWLKQLHINIFSRPGAVSVSTTRRYSTEAWLCYKWKENLKCMPWKYSRMHKQNMPPSWLMSNQGMRALPEEKLFHTWSLWGVFWNTSAYLT